MFVRVHNRGPVDAGAVTVTIFAAKVTGAGTPAWTDALHGNQWVVAGGIGVADVTKAAGATE